MPSDPALTCDEVAVLLADAADGAVSLGARARGHVDECLRCQAEAAQYRKLLRALRSLRTDLVDPAPGLLTELSASLDEGAGRRAGRSRTYGRRVAYVGAAAAATAAGVGGAIVLASRTRRRLPLAG